MGGGGCGGVGAVRGGGGWVGLRRKRKIAIIAAQGNANYAAANNAQTYFQSEVFA